MGEGKEKRKGGMMGKDRREGMMVRGREEWRTLILFTLCWSLQAKPQRTHIQQLLSEARVAVKTMKSKKEVYTPVVHLEFVQGGMKQLLKNSRGGKATYTYMYLVVQ